MSILKFLSGKKSYIVMGMTFVIGGLHALGYIDDHMFLSLMGMFAGLGLGSLKSGQVAQGEKIEEKINQVESKVDCK